MSEQDTQPDNESTQPAENSLSSSQDERFMGRRWQDADRRAARVRTANEPPYLTQDMGMLLQFARAVADETRILILALLAEEDRPMYGQEMAERLGVTPQTISHHLNILKNASLVREKRENAYRYYSLDTESIQQLRKTLFADDRLALPTKREERARVLAIFIKDGRLVSIPVQRTKLRYVLEELARSFEWGRLYEEREVNAILKQFHDDTARLRRELVDEKIMMRENGRYWLVRPHTSSDL
jgi:ArsR family transcriptional regulator, arsenate/arsenite/antimonite-responsive transcriptional repressor